MLAALSPTAIILHPLNVLSKEGCLKHYAITVDVSYRHWSFELRTPSRANMSLRSKAWLPSHSPSFCAPATPTSSGHRNALVREFDYPSQPPSS
ncbi:hypothetical protein VTO73DRAFT_11404 [Trametes versicolor]